MQKQKSCAYVLNISTKWCEPCYSCIYRLGKEDSEGTESDSWSEDSGSDKLSRTLSNNSSKAWDVASLDSNSDQAGSWTAKDNELYLQYNETSPYWQRVPFSEKVASDFKWYGIHNFLSTTNDMFLCSVSRAGCLLMFLVSDSRVS